MRRRFATLTLALVALLGPAGAAPAHSLDAKCYFFPKGMVRVESWFSNGETPKAGQVEVFGKDDELLVKGRLSSQGLFLFDAPEGQRLRVVVNAGEGHRKELPVEPGEVIVAAATEPAAAPEPPPEKHEQPFPLKDVLAGVGLLVAVAAFALGLRNARRLAALEKGKSEE